MRIADRVVTIKCLPVVVTSAFDSQFSRAAPDIVICSLLTF